MRLDVLESSSWAIPQVFGAGDGSGSLVLLIAVEDVRLVVLKSYLLASLVQDTKGPITPTHARGVASSPTTIVLCRDCLMTAIFLVLYNAVWVSSLRLEVFSASACPGLIPIVCDHVR